MAKSCLSSVFEEVELRLEAQSRQPRLEKTAAEQGLEVIDEILSLSNQLDQEGFSVTASCLIKVAERAYFELQQKTAHNCGSCELDVSDEPESVEDTIEELMEKLEDVKDETLKDESLSEDLEHLATIADLWEPRHEGHLDEDVLHAITDSLEAK